MENICDNVKRKALELMYPQATKVQITKMLLLSKEKNIGIPVPKSTPDLDNLLGSIIRHEDTHYEEMLRSGLSRAKARSIIQTRISRAIKYLSKQD